MFALIIQSLSNTCEDVKTHYSENGCCDNLQTESVNTMRPSNDHFTVRYAFAVVDPSTDRNVELLTMIKSAVATTRTEPGNIGYEWYMETDENANYVKGYTLERYNTFADFIPLHALPPAPWSTIQTPILLELFGADANARATINTVGLGQFTKFAGSGIRNFGYGPCDKKGTQVSSDVISFTYEFAVVNPSQDQNKILEIMIQQAVTNTAEEPGSIGYEWFLTTDEEGIYTGGMTLESYSSFSAFIPGHTSPPSPWSTIQTPAGGLLRHMGATALNREFVSMVGLDGLVTHLGDNKRISGYSSCGW